MTHRARSTFALALLVSTAFAAAAEAGTLFKGTAIILSRSATAACAQMFAVGDAWTMEYRPNLGAAVNETLLAIGQDGALLLTSSDIINKSLNGVGTAVSQVMTFALPLKTTASATALTVVPPVPNAGTPLVGVAGGIANIIPGCNVTFAASLLKLPGSF